MTFLMLLCKSCFSLCVRACVCRCLWETLCSWYALTDQSGYSCYCIRSKTRRYHIISRHQTVTTGVWRRIFQEVKSQPGQSTFLGNWTCSWIFRRAESRMWGYKLNLKKGSDSVFTKGKTIYTFYTHTPSKKKKKNSNHKA